MTNSARNLVVSVASRDALDVRSFRVEQRMNALFECSITAVSENPAIDFDGVVGQRAAFRVTGDSPASWVGICRHIEQIAVEERGLSTYRLSIVPELWLATQRRNHRIFQNLSELEIALQILGEWGVQPALQMAGAYKKRNYRVQYGETDFAFASRMLEEAGISFYFRVSDDASGLVLTDSPHLAEPRPAPLPFRENATGLAMAHVTKIRVAQEARSGRVTLRDHDPALPPSYPLAASASGALPHEGRLEHFEYAPGAFLFGHEHGEPEVATPDRPRARSDEKEASALAQKRLLASRGGARALAFETNAMDPAPGTVLGITDHPRPDLGPGKTFLVVASSHAGTVNGPWTHACEARGTDAPYCPPLVTPKPRISGVESATVVGPAGEEIHTDELGRVRVHFHWDRESRMDQKSSCWIPVSQSWSGAGYGGVNLPRVGQEVLVDFLGGDPDHPVITGRVYTGLQTVPYKLPQNKTQSGWRGSSSPHTGGFNEILFEDAAGRELVNMQAERDLKKLVKNDEAVTIGHDRAKLVKNDDSLEVGRDRQKLVQNDESITIGRDRKKVVQNDETVAIGRDRQKLVQNDESITIGRDRKKVVQNDETVAIGNSRTKTVARDETVTIGKNRNKRVRNNEKVTIGNNATQTVRNNAKVQVGKNLVTQVLANAREVTGLMKNVSVGVSRSTQVGLIDATMVGQTHLITVMPAGENGVPEEMTLQRMTVDAIESRVPGGTAIFLNRHYISLETGAGATILLQDDKIFLNAKHIVLESEDLKSTTKERTSLYSEKDIEAYNKEARMELKTAGDIVLSGNGAVEVQGKKDVSVYSFENLYLNC